MKTTSESVTLEKCIRRFFPRYGMNSQKEAIRNLHYLIELAYLRGQLSELRRINEIRN